MKTYIKKPKLKFKEGDSVFFLCKKKQESIKGVIKSLYVSSEMHRLDYGFIVNNFGYLIHHKERQTVIAVDEVFSTKEELEKYYNNCFELDFYLGQELYDINLEKEKIKELNFFTKIDSKKPYNIKATTDKCCNSLLFEEGKKCKISNSENSMFTLEHWRNALKKENDNN